MAHIAVPIEISPIAEQIKDVFDYASKLSDLGKKLGNDSQGGLMVKALSYSTDQKLSLLSRKFETLVFYLTKKETYNANNVEDLIHKRSIPIDHILPRHSIKAPRFSQNTLSILQHGFTRAQTRGHYQKKNLETPGDNGVPNGNTGNNVDDERVASRAAAFWKWWGQTTSTTTAKPTQMAWVSTVGPNTTTTTTTASTTANNTSPPVSWMQMHATGVDMGDDKENVPPPGETKPLYLEDSIFDHFAQDFFMETDYPELYTTDPYYTFDDEVQNIVKRSAPHNGLSTEPHDNTKPNSPLSDPHHLAKRQVLMPVVLSMLASIGVSSIFGGVSAAQIDAIKNQESNLAANQKMIIHQTAANSRGILVNRNMVDSLGNLTLKLAHFTEINHFENSGLLLFAIMMSELDRVEECLDTYVSIIQSANVGKFHPAVLSQEAAVAAFESVAAAADLRGMKPIINTPQQMAQLHTHYSFSPRGVKIIITLPLVSRHNSFELYRFNALPIPIGDAAYLYLVPNVPLIGIGETDLTGRATFVELTHETLSQCQKLGKTHICDQQTIIKKSSAESCIYALYLSDHRTADDLCRTYVEKKDRDIVVALGNNRFAHYSLNPSTYFFRCQNGSNSQTRQLTGITEIEVPEGCAAITAHFILRAKVEIFIDAPPKHFRWAESALSLLGNKSDLSSLDKVIDAYKKARALPALDPKSIDDMLEKQKPFYEAHPAPISAIALATFAVLLVLGVIFYIWYQLYRAKQAELRLASPKIRLGDLLENNERLDLLEQLLNRQRELGAEPEQLQLL